MNNNKNFVTEFIPTFHNKFYTPRYWVMWLGIGIITVFALIPPRLRNPFLGSCGRIIGRLAKKVRFRARINLMYCLPEIDISQREKIIDNMFACIMQSIILIAELACRNPQQVLSYVHWHGDELLVRLRNEGNNVIFLVPHGWTVDIPAMLMAARGQKIAAMFHNQSNELIDYLWNRIRKKFGGRMHARNDGIKPFIS